MTCGVFRCISVELGVFRCISVFTLTRCIYASMKHRLVCVGLMMIDLCDVLILRGWYIGWGGGRRNRWPGCVIFFLCTHLVRDNVMSIFN